MVGLLVLGSLAPLTAGAAPVADTGTVLVATDRRAGVEHPHPARRIRWGRYAIGDSVMLGAAGGLRARNFRVDAEVSRQFVTGIGVVQRLARSGQLPRKVILHLGNNGTVPGDACRRLGRSIGPHRMLWLISLKVPRSWQDANNRILRTCAHRHERVVLIPWNIRAHGHPGWFASDGYHLTGSGRVAYTTLVDRYVARHIR
jgi:hypothetical protein